MQGKIDRLRGAFLEVLEARIKEHVGTGESEAIQELVCWVLITFCDSIKYFNFFKVDFERMAFKSAQTDTLKKISS